MTVEIFLDQRHDCELHRNHILGSRADSELTLDRGRLCSCLPEQPLASPGASAENTERLCLSLQLSLIGIVRFGGAQKTE
jgi:hypothetical protein